MAQLTASQKQELKEAIAQVKTPWVLFGVDASAEALSGRIGGLAGLIDWRVHGQVSRLLAKNLFPGDGFCVIPGDPGRGCPSFLAFQFGAEPEVKFAAERIRKLGIRELTVAESTFPEDFSRKLKQTLTKEGNSWFKLES